MRKIISSLLAQLNDEVGCYLLMTRDFRIIGANKAYRGATFTVGRRLSGSGMFDAFPDNPAYEYRNGVRNLTGSLKAVVETGAPHSMLLQRYDVRSREGRLPQGAIAAKGPI